MPNQFQTVNVPGVGPVNFPSGMAQADIADAIDKNFPQVKIQADAAREEQTRRFSAGISSMLPQGPQFKPMDLMPKLTPPNTERSWALSEFNTQRSEGNRVLSGQGGGSVAPLPSIQEMPNALSGVMDSNERAQARADLQMTSGTDAAADLRKRLNASYAAVGGTLGTESGVAGLGAEKAAQFSNYPLLPHALDIAALPAVATSEAFGKGPGPYKNVGTVGIPNMLAETKRAPGTLEPAPSSALEIAKGVGRGLYGAGTALTTPGNIALAAGMTVMPEAGLGKLAQVGFTAQTGVGAYQAGKKFLQDNTAGSRAEDATNAVVNLGLTALGAHGLHGDQAVDAVKNNPEPAVQDQANKAAVQQSAPQPVVPPPSPLNLDTLTPIKATPKPKAKVGPLFDMSESINKAIPKAGGGEIPAEAVPQVSAKPLDSGVAKPVDNPQAINPSIGPSLDDIESRLRPQVGYLVRLRQLAIGARNRLDIDYALHSVRGQDPDNPGMYSPNENPLAVGGHSFDSLRPGRQHMIQTVADSLGVSVDSIADNHWRLTDDQVKTLRDVRKAGLRPIPTPDDPFGATTPHPYAADINQANAKAVGIPNAKDLISQLHEADRNEFRRRRDLSKAAVDQARQSSSEVASGDLSVVGGHKATAGGHVTGGMKDLDSIMFEHEMMQKVVSQRLEQAQTDIIPTLKEWRLARATEKKPSLLAQQVAALSDKTGLPEELYAPQHLGPKSAPFSSTSSVSQPIPSTKGPKAINASEGPISTPQPEDQGGAVLDDKIKTLLEDTKSRHGSIIGGGFSAIINGVKDKYHNPDTVTKAFYLLAKDYSRNLDAKMTDPLKATMDKLDKMPPEAGESTLYANPLPEILNKMLQPKPTVSAAKADFPSALAEGRIPEQPITDLLDRLNNRDSTPDGATKQFNNYVANETQKFVEGWKDAPGTFKERLSKLGDFFTQLGQLYKNRPGLDQIDLANGIRNLKVLQAGIEVKDFQDKLNELHPRNDRKISMAVYLEAGGGRLGEAEVSKALSDQAAELEGRASLNHQANKLFKYYQMAGELTDHEKQTVSDYRDYLHVMEQREAEAGLEHEPVLDYIQHIWSKDNFIQQGVAAIQSGRGFGKTAHFEKMRTFENYFEGIAMGFKPNSMDINYLISARAMASARVLANRSFVDRLRNETMADGSKAVMQEGSGTYREPNPDSRDKTGAFLIGHGTPKAAVTPDGRPYYQINHGSFQNWKWVGTDPKSGTEILYKGSMLVHPDLAPKLRRLLEPSALRQPELLGSKVLGSVTGALFKGSSIGKQTLLVGLFHPVQLGVHFAEHAMAGVGFNRGGEGATSARAMRALNPWSNEKFIDLTDEKQQMLVVHGMIVRPFDAESMIDEGVMSRGFMNGMPFAGGMWRALHDSIFTKYIPNLKMAMGMDALDRNMIRYHDKWTKDLITQKYGTDISKASPADWTQASIASQSKLYRLTGEQMNAAFGGINWAALPVNKTFQDVMRLLVLAPDFLLARMQFVGDAFRPGGAESRRALLVGAGLQYIAARAFNSAMNNGDPKWSAKDWNKFVNGHEEYSLRTVQGDMTDAVFDPRRFITHRINPLWRPVTEAWTGKDIYGQQASAGQQLFDAAQNFVPMPAQGAVNKFASTVDPSLRSNRGEDTVADTILQSLTGIQRRQYRTPAEREAFDDFNEIKGPPSTDEQAMEQRTTFNDLRDKFRSGKLTPQMITQAINNPKGNLKASEIPYLYDTATDPQIVTKARYLQFDQVDSIFDKGNNSEKQSLIPVLVSKISSLAPNDPKLVSTLQKINKFQQSLSPEERVKNFKAAQAEIAWEQRPR
jgi:hypothetical protein